MQTIGHCEMEQTLINMMTKHFEVEQNFLHTIRYFEGVREFIKQLTGVEYILKTFALDGYKIIRVLKDSDTDYEAILMTWKPNRGGEQQ